MWKIRLISSQEIFESLSDEEPVQDTMSGVLCISWTSIQGKPYTLYPGVVATVIIKGE
ncbi:MAG: hypothetical protein Q7S33_02360 [Nanoarchaeota archaeon]|nr:hypothetical protein [Nanoarchaeota archaeon]